MPRQRSSMRKIREVLRQKWALGLSIRRIARSVGLSRPSVSSYLRRAEGCGLSWPLPAELDDAELERRLFPPLPPSSVARPEPDWVEVHRELKGKGVTLELLWDEYKAANPDGYQYSTFCQYYGAGATVSTWSCARIIGPERSCSWITPGNVACNICDTAANGPHTWRRGPAPAPPRSAIRR